MILCTFNFNKEPKLLRTHVRVQGVKGRRLVLGKERHLDELFAGVFICAIISLRKGYTNMMRKLLTILLTLSILNPVVIRAEEIDNANEGQEQTSVEEVLQDEVNPEDTVSEEEIDEIGLPEETEQQSTNPEYDQETVQEENDPQEEAQVEDTVLEEDAVLEEETNVAENDDPLITQEALEEANEPLLSDDQEDGAYFEREEEIVDASVLGLVDKTEMMHIQNTEQMASTGVWTPEEASKYESNPYNYTYKVTPLLEPFNDYVYVQTDNPYPQSFRFLDKDTIYNDGSEGYQAAFHHESLVLSDVVYTDKSIARVKDGYLFLAYSGNPDGGELTLQYDPNGYSQRGSIYSYSTNWKDTTITVDSVSMKSSVDVLIDQLTNPGMSFFAKMDAVQEYLTNYAVYPFAVYDPSKPNARLPYPFLYSSNWQENPLMDYYAAMYSQAGYSVLYMAYPYILDSLGFPGVMSSVARKLAPDCEIASGSAHTNIIVTYNGESKTYGGQGKGADDNTVYQTDFTHFLTFDGGVNDLSNASVDSWFNICMDLKSASSSHTATWEDMLHGDTFHSTIGPGAWVKVNTQSFNVGDNYGFYYPSSSSNSYHYCASDAWVDGMYVDKYELYVSGERFEDHPTSKVILTDVTYTDSNNITHTGALVYKYDSSIGKWSAKDYYSYWSSATVPDMFYLTESQVRELIASNNRGIPAKGYVYNGTVMPGTPFENNVRVTGIDLPDTYTLAWNTTGSVTATVYPENASYDSVRWVMDSYDYARGSTSSDDNRKTVTLRPQAEGTFTLTATTEDGGFSDSCVVTVRKFPVESIEIENGDFSLKHYEEVQLSTVYNPTYAVDKSVTYESSDTSVVSIIKRYSSYYAYASGLGTATITATSGNGKTDTITVTVLECMPDSIAFDNEENEISLNNTTSIRYSIEPSRVTNDSVTVVSADESIATIESASGGNVRVNGVGEGTTTLTITTANGKTDTCSVTVKPVELSSIKFRKASYEFNGAESGYVYFDMYPSNASDKTLVATSSDPSILRFSSPTTWYVWGRSYNSGTVTLTLTASNGVSASCEVKVNPVYPETIAFNEETGSCSVGSTVGLSYAIMPSNVTEKEVTFASSNESVAQIESKGNGYAYIKGVSPGKATITATTVNGLTATSEVMINPIEVSRVTINYSTISANVGEDPRQLTATVYPTTATDKSLTWSSSDPSVATVDQTGLVRGLKEGTAIVSAVANNGISGTCQVNVRFYPATGIALDKNSLLMGVGDSGTLSATINPSNASDKTVTWTSSDPSVATVDNNGTVMAKAEGTTTITASTHNGLTAQCMVTVDNNYHMVSFSANGGSGEPSFIGKENGVAVALPDTVPTRFPYNFLGWSGNQDATVADYLPGDSFNDDSVSTLYAVWSEASSKTMPFVDSVDILMGGACHYMRLIPPTSGKYTISSSGSLDTYGYLYDSNGANLAKNDDGGLGHNFSITYVFDSNETYYLKANFYSSWQKGSFGIEAVQIIDAESVTLNKTTLMLAEGASETLLATVLPNNTTDKTLTWTSSDTSIATVDSNGLVSAIAEGTAEITVSTSNGKTATCSVTVGEFRFAEITRQPESQLVVKGEMAIVSLAASGDGLTYQWYLKNKTGTKFSKSSVTSDTYSVKMSDAVDGRQIYCVVMDQYGNRQTSNTVTLTQYVELSIVEQPKDVFVKDGEKAVATVEATGNGLTYQWYLKNKTGVRFSKSSVTKNTYTVTMSDAVDGRQIYCVISDQYGSQVTSDTVTLSQSKPLAIITQPQSVSVANGQKAVALVEATGEGLTYQWYLKSKTGTKFSKSSVTKNTYSVTMSDTVDGRQVYCIVSDQYGNSVTSNTVTLTMKAQLAIVTQPKDVTVENGQTARVTVEATGAGLSYQWYIKNNTATKFSKSSVTKNTYSVTMSDTVDGRQIYCVVSDQYGNSITSNTATLHKSATLAIVTQPQNVTVAKGEQARVTVEATGSGLAYQWYVKNKTATKFFKSSVTKKTYSVTMSDAVNGRELYCIVTDQYGNSVTTRTVKLSQVATLTIVEQPYDVYAAIGDRASTNVVAQGSGLTYQWYVKNRAATKFSLSSVKSATYSTTMTDNVDGRKAYCIITDANGNQAQTVTVTFTKIDRPSNIRIGLE